MNTKFLLVQAVIAVCVSQGFSLTCETCKGTDCSQEVEQLECNRHTVALPLEIGSENKIVSDNAEYGCLSLDYETGNDVTQLRQCIQVETDRDVCGELMENLKVKKCSVSNYNLRNIREDITTTTVTVTTPTTASVSVTTPTTVSQTTPTTVSETTPTTVSETTPSIVTPETTPATTPATDSGTVIQTSSMLTLFMVVLFGFYM